MSRLESLQSQGPDPRMPHEYIGPASEFHLRMIFYEYALHPTSLYLDAYDGLDLRGDEVIADVGAGDSRNLSTLVTERGHSGQLLAIDANKDYAEYSNTLALPKNVQVLIAKLPDLPFNTPVADVLMSILMMYHVPEEDLIRGLEMFFAMGTDGAKAALATSGPANKQKQRRHELDMAEFLGTTPPPRFSQTFDTSIARDVLGFFMTDVSEIPDRQKARFPASQMLTRSGDYFMSLLGMRPSFGPMADTPYPSGEEYWEAYKEVVLPGVIRELEQTGGYYYDDVDRVIFTGTKI